MKYIKTLIIALLCATNSYAQFDGGNNDGHALQTIQFDFSTLSEIYVPDDNFEQALIDLGYDSGALDDYVPTANINIITTLDVSNENIEDLTGIEHFIMLTHLNCANNLLTNLDVSFNTLLIQLNCYSNKLSSIDVSQNTNLTSLQCYTNLINTLDISQNTALTNLNCSNNQISSLDLSLNTQLAQLACNINTLTSLNVKNGTNTNVTLFNSANNSNLSCIEVDDANYSTANWTGIDAASSFSENCSTLSFYSLNEEEFSFYPNPVSNQLIVSTKIDGRFSIINVNGQNLKQGGLINGENKIEMLQLKAGLYFLKIESENGSILKKIIKK